MKKQNQRSRILFVGLNTIDIQYIVADYPESNTKNKAIHSEIYTGGPATNAAIACAFLGSGVDLLTPVGKHALSGFIYDDLKSAGIGILDPIRNKPGFPVFSSIVTSRKNGDRTVFYYQPEVKSKMVFDTTGEINKYRLVMFDGFFPEFALPIAKFCRQNGITTVLDGGSWKEYTQELLGYMDIAICSNDFHIPQSNASGDVFKYLHNQGVNYAAITRGEKSILYSCFNNQGEIQINPVNVVDTLGAGDIFHGAFCHYFTSGNDFTDSLFKASKVASQSCRTFGTRQWMTPLFIII